MSTPSRLREDRGVAVDARVPTAQLAADPAPTAIRTHNLTKTYGARNAVDRLSLEVPTGVIAGFVGPNGAGKTTTIRMLLGLIRPTTGTVHVLGTPDSRPSDYLARVGAMIEGPAVYPGMSARRNLEILATLGGIAEDTIGPILQQVGLSDRAGDNVKTYSLGMRQRLGIAAALLPNPALLILDEPTNGLDPEGILEVRHLLQDLKARGVTILVSSHLLSEVEHIADWIIMIKDGQSLYQGPMSDLLRRQSGALVVRADNEQELRIVAAVARKQHFECEMSEGGLRVLAPGEFAGPLNRLAMEAGVVLTEIRQDRTSLEETFFTLTEGAA